MSEENNMLTFGGHLEVLRKMLLRIIVVIAAVAVAVFCFKDLTWRILLAPSECDFVTYRAIEDFIHSIGFAEFHFEEYHVNMISTDLSSQFMEHITTSLYLGFLFSFPYILWELLRFTTPALYDNEKKYSVLVALAIFFLSAAGVLMSYFILFPISFRFLGTYSVSSRIVSNITLDSYVSTFVGLTITMGLVFQLPIIAFVLAKMGLIRHEFLARYKKHALLIIMIVAAIITPPDLMTLILVTLPLYLLFLFSIFIIKKAEPQKTEDSQQ